MYQRLRTFVERYERRLSFAALSTGFVLDNLTLRRVDLWFENLALASYILFAGTAIFFLALDIRQTRWGGFVARVQSFAPLIMQFAFGGLFSGFFVFYSRSGSLATSWPFIVLLVGLLVGNEFFRTRYERLSFQLAIYFVSVFSYMTFLLPVLVHKIGDGIFMAGTILSVMLMFVFLRIIERVGGERVGESRMHARRNVIALAAVFVVLYLNNVIPPLPLALREGGVYHNVTRIGSTYLLEDESRTLRDRFSRAPTIHIIRGEELAAYSAVFAPTALNTTIYHDWQYYNEEKGEWESRFRFPYNIVGGKDGGYRGHSLKSNVLPGLWRVNIETADGRIIGRMKRTVALVDVPVERTRMITH